MKLSPMALLFCSSALVGVSSGFNFANVFPEFSPTVLYYPSPGKYAKCNEIYPASGFKPYYKAFSCDRKAEGTEVCACVRGHISNKTITRDGTNFYNLCGTCQKGLVPIKEHYGLFQTLSAWKQVLMGLSKVNATTYEALFGDYRTMVLPAGLGENMFALELMRKELRFVLSQGGNFQANGAKFVTGLMAEMAPFTQGAVSQLQNFLKFPEMLKKPCEKIVKHFKVLTKNGVDALNCLQTGNVKAYGGGGQAVSASGPVVQSCQGLQKDSAIFEAFGAQKREAAIPACALNSLWA